MSSRKKIKAETVKKRVHVLFDGRVQGVGFRFTTEHIALNLGLRGWVMNLPDRRVELVCEGRVEDLKGLLEKINSAFPSFVREQNVHWAPCKDEFSDFKVRYF